MHASAPASESDRAHVSFLPFFVVTTGAALGALLTRRSPGVSRAFGLGGLGLAFATALAITPGETLPIGDGAIVTSEYQRLLLVLGAATGLLLCVVGLATVWQRNVPAAALASLAWTGLALASPDPGIAVAATIGAGLAGLLVTVVTPIDDRGVQVTVGKLRSIAVAGMLGLIAVTWVARLPGASGLDPAVVGLAYLAMAVALALRFAVIPFHAWVGQLSQSAPGMALPILLAWAPAGLAVVALTWVDGSIAPLGLPLSLERGVVVAIGTASLALGTFAAWIQDDVEHVVGYSIAQDAGFVILALAATGPSSWEPARTWILIFVLAKTALAAWALALQATYGTRHLDDLTGWARRSPFLGLAFVLTVAATLGWPGSVAWAARLELIRIAVADPLRMLLVLAAFSSLAYYLRLAVIGLRVPGPTVLDRAALRLRWPRSLMGGEARKTGTSEDPAQGARRDIWPAAIRTVARGRAFLSTELVPAWRMNRVPAATAVVLALATLAAIAAAGGLGIPEAARAGPPQAAPLVSRVP